MLRIVPLMMYRQSVSSVPPMAKRHEAAGESQILPDLDDRNTTYKRRRLARAAAPPYKKPQAAAPSRGCEGET
jgi:hypothetical protein